MVRVRQRHRSRKWDLQAFHREKVISGQGQQFTFLCLQAGPFWAGQGDYKSNASAINLHKVVLNWGRLPVS